MSFCTGSGLRWGARVLDRPLSPARSGKQNTVSGAKTLRGLIELEQVLEASLVEIRRSWVFLPYASSPKTGARLIFQLRAR